MLKVNAILIAILLLLTSVTAYEVSTGTLVNKIVDGKTLISNQKAYVTTKEGYVEQEPYKLKEGEKARIKVNPSKNDGKYTVCFDFHGKEDLVKINTFEKREFFGLMNKDLKKINKQEGLVCMETTLSEENTFEFEAKYYGLGELKYDVIIPELNITLDPYLIGNYATDSLLYAYLPFNNNLSVVFASKRVELNNSEVREITTSGYSYTDFTSSGGGCQNPTFAYDGSYSSYAGMNYIYGYSSCAIYLEMNKTTSDTAMILQSKDQGGYRNITIPQSCFDYFTNYVSVYVVLETNGIGSGSESTTYYCYDGSYSTMLSVNPTGDEKLYETTTYFTNSSNFYSSQQLNLNSEYIIQGDDAIAGYVFNFGNSSDYFGSNDGSDTLIRYNNEGVVFNTSAKIEISSTNKLNFTGSFSFVGYIKVNSVQSSAFPRIFSSLGSGANTGYELFISSGRYKLQGGNGSYVSLDSGILANYDLFDVVAVTYDNNTGNMTFYVNGVQGASSNISQGAIGGSDAIPTFGVSQYYLNPLNGTISSFYYYNNTLSSEQVINLNNSGSFTDNILGEQKTAINFSESDYVLVNTSLSGNISYSWWQKEFNGSWQHIVWLPGVTSYVNSVVSSLPGGYSYPLAMNYTNNTLSIGSSENGYFNGSIDEFMVFGYHLSASDVNYLYQGYNTTIRYGACLGSLEYPALYIYFYDRSTNDPISLKSGFNLNATNSTDSYASSGTLIIGTNATICTQIPPSYYEINLSLSGLFTLEKADYVTTLYTVTTSDELYMSNVNPPTLNLYIIPTANSSTVEFTWVSTNFEYLDGTMRIYECSVDGTKVLVDSIATSGGVAYGNIELLTQAYAYDFVYDGEVYKDDAFYTCHVESSTSRSYYVNLITEDVSPVVGLYTLDCSLRKVGDNIVSMSWTNNPVTGQSLEGCLVAYRDSIYNKTEIYRNCTSTANAMTRTIPNDGLTYYVTGEINQSGTIGYCRDTIVFYNAENGAESFGIAAILAVIFLIIGLVLLYNGDTDSQIGMCIIALLGSWVFGILEFSWQWVSGIIAFLVIVAVVVKNSR